MAKERFMEFVGAYVIQSVADTDASVAFDVPSSETELMALLVHQIDWEGQVSTPVAAVTIGIDGFLTYSAQIPSSVGGYLTKMDVIDTLQRAVAAGTTLDDVVAGNYFAALQHDIHKFDPPILIARRTLHLHIRSSNSAVVNAVALRLGYTLEKVTQAAFIAALVAHH